ncbi:helix-turn-helix domain-containing protein [Lentilactobacillus sp. SPB1-3]|uniref:Helix-turn-helix domain-containing protein n=1 Tax=Lentilactobacillus terminaliae TaxID=3003483 RepID=A0ACD5DDN5_9LACO|nr:helix-turn-helix transcriptional regulator [Lentilactobacillus sp. SPB1-3]MCZ0977996.1 helix-turn-helix transcriptional regulator [Lentilactobacillus sp. SPB1-3]
MNLRTRRIELKLTQSEVAKRAGISLRQYQRIESGKDTMFSVYVKIARVLGIRLEQLA